MTSNVQKLKDAYAAWAASGGTDPAVWEPVVSDRFVIRTVLGSVGDPRFSSTYDQDTVQGYYAALGEAFEIKSHEPIDFFADGDKVVVVIEGEWSNRETGQTLKTEKVDLWRFENGRAVEFSELGDSAAMARLLDR